MVSLAAAANIIAPMKLPDVYSAFVFSRGSDMSQVIEGQHGGNLIVEDDGVVKVFFWERFATGRPCTITLGRVTDALRALQPAERLDLPIEGIDIIYAHRSGKGVMLHILSTYRHPANMIIVSQEELREALRAPATAA